MKVAKTTPNKPLVPFGLKVRDEYGAFCVILAAGAVSSLVAVRALATLLLVAMLTACAPTPKVEINVRLDPASREFSAHAVLTGINAPVRFALDPGLRITRLVLDGRTLPVPSANHVSVPAGRRLLVEYAGRLPPLPQADQRQVLGQLPAGASVEGSFLPAGSGWYPDPGVPFAYRLRLTLPKGQKGLVPGNLLRESEGVGGYTAEFDFPHPSKGIDLIAGPYTVSERVLTLPGKQRVRIRTWFHPQLAGLEDAYLADSARYIERYSRLIGPYPFADFSVVSSPLPVGLGMPSLAYLGREVLKLPFVRATSLGHEVLHNWWGNGVYPDWARGNWSEGLTTFLADYAYKEDESPEAAREMRLNWLRNLAAVPEGEDFPLSAFTSRHHGMTSIIGYDKAAMVFLMLRDEIGQEAFERGLRLIWNRYRFRAASWAELERAWSEAAGRDISAFFRQWVERRGAPRLKLISAEADGDKLHLTLAQSGEPYVLSVPVGLRISPERLEMRRVALTGARATVTLPISEPVQAVELDPDYRLWRRIDQRLLPPILREVFIAPRAALMLADADPAWQTAGRQLASRVLDHPATPVTAAGQLPEGTALLIVGSHSGVARLLAQLNLPAKPAALVAKGSAQVWAGRAADGRPYAVVSADDPAALAALIRPLPHYGQQSWLSFKGAHVQDKGIWPARSERLTVTQRGR